MNKKENAVEDYYDKLKTIPAPKSNSCYHLAEYSSAVHAAVKSLYDAGYNAGFTDAASFKVSEIDKN